MSTATYTRYELLRALRNKRFFFFSFSLDQSTRNEVNMVETRSSSSASKRFCSSSSPEPSASSPRPSKRSKVKIDAASTAIESVRFV